MIAFRADVKIRVAAQPVGLHVAKCLEPIHTEAMCSFFARSAPTE